MSSPGKKVFTFSLWMMLIPLTAFIILTLFVNGILALFM